MWLLVNVTQITHDTHTYTYYISNTNYWPTKILRKHGTASKSKRSKPWSSIFQTAASNFGPKTSRQQMGIFLRPRVVGRKAYFQVRTVSCREGPKENLITTGFGNTPTASASLPLETNVSPVGLEKGCNVGKKINQTCLTQEVYRIGFTPNSNRSTTVHGYDERGFKKMQIKTYVCNFAQRGIDSSTWLQRMH